MVVNFFAGEAAHGWVAGANHKCAWDFAQALLVHSDHGCIGATRVLEKDCLEFCWCNLPSMKEG